MAAGFLLEKNQLLAGFLNVLNVFVAFCCFLAGFFQIFSKKKSPNVFSLAFEEKPMMVFCLGPLREGLEVSY